MYKKNPTVLVILDGFGYSPEKKYNAIAHAHKPHLDTWFDMYPHTIIEAAGTAVGLLPGYIGNSEVGHLTIGSGRVIKQPVSFIHEAIDNKLFFSNKILINNLQKLQKNNGSLHIMGLLSDAGVHSHEKHLYAFLHAAQEQGITSIFVHPFLDGRDVPPKSARTYLGRLQEQLDKLKYGQIGSLHGRFYAMDRDKNWQRTRETYQVLTEEQPIMFHNWKEVLDHYYMQGVTDEFIPPTQLHTQSIIKNGDGIIFFNFRPDRARQLTESFIDPHFDAFKIKKISLAMFVTPVAYNAYVTVNSMFPTPLIKNTLKEILSHEQKTIFSIAETEKYAHVTYFFSGGHEQLFKGETQILIPSITAKNYVDHPCMSANEITQAVLQSLHTNPCDFYLINYANADMVGHSGDFNATVKAIECLDEQLKKLYDQIIEKMDGTMYITADHGNAEDKYDEVAKQPRTAHTNNPVPFIMINKKLKNKKSELHIKQLADLAPLILVNLGLEVPDEMKK